MIPPRRSKMPETRARGALYVRAGRLITGRPAHPDRPTQLGAGIEVIEDAALRIEDGRIVAAGPASQVAPPDDPLTPVLDYSAYTVLPGLVDAHVHLTFRR